MKHVKLSIAIAGLLMLQACTGKTVIKEVLVTSPTTVAAPVVTEAPAKQTNKYDDYLAGLRDYSGKANSMTDAELIEFADLVCAVFDEGYSLDDVVGVFAENSTGQTDNQLYAGIIGGAVAHICPEYAGLLESNT